MSLNTIADEVYSDRTARVTGGSALKTEARYFASIIGSSTASGTIYAGAGCLHTVNTGSTAAAAILALYDAATAAAIGSLLGITEINLGTQQQRLYDVVFGTGLTYRLSGAEGANVTVTYSKGA